MLLQAMKEAKRISQISISSINYHGRKEMIIIEVKVVIKMDLIHIRKTEAVMMA